MPADSMDTVELLADTLRVVAVSDPSRYRTLLELETVIGIRAMLGKNCGARLLTL